MEDASGLVLKLEHQSLETEHWPLANGYARDDSHLVGLSQSRRSLDRQDSYSVSESYLPLEDGGGGGDEHQLASHASQSNLHQRPFCCPWPDGCNKRFNRKSDLQRHFRIHTNERPYSCKVTGCGKSFIQRSALTVHHRTHSGEKPHVCEVITCGKRFSDSSSLARHRRIHTGKRPYKCPVHPCEKSFCRKTTLTKHAERSHRGFISHPPYAGYDDDSEDDEDKPDDDIGSLSSGPAYVPHYNPGLWGIPESYPNYDTLAPHAHVALTRSQVGRMMCSSVLNGYPHSNLGGGVEDLDLNRNAVYPSSMSHTLAQNGSFFRSTPSLPQINTHIAPRNYHLASALPTATSLPPSTTPNSEQILSSAESYQSSPSSTSHEGNVQDFPESHYASHARHHSLKTADEYYHPQDQYAVRPPSKPLSVVAPSHEAYHPESAPLQMPYQQQMVLYQDGNGIPQQELDPRHSQSFHSRCASEGFHGQPPLPETYEPKSETANPQHTYETPGSHVPQHIKTEYEHQQTTHSLLPPAPQAGEMEQQYEDAYREPEFETVPTQPHQPYALYSLEPPRPFISLDAMGYKYEDSYMLPSQTVPGWDEAA